MIHKEIRFIADDLAFWKKDMDYQHRERMIQSIRWIIRGRWIILVGAGALGLIQKFIGASSIHLSVAAIIIILIVTSGLNIGYTLWLRSAKEGSLFSLRALTFFQVFIDQLVYTGVIYFTGGIESLSFVFYILPILSATVLYQTFGIMMFAFLNVLLYIGLIYTELIGIIIHRPRYFFDPGIFQNIDVTISNVLLVVATIALASVFTTFISRMLREREREIVAEWDKVTSMLKAFPDGVIMLDPDLRISFMNEQAKSLFQMSEWEDPSGRQLTVHLVPKLMKDVVPALRKKPKNVSEITHEVEYGIGPEKMILRLSTIPLVDRNRVGIGMMKVLHDITREREIDRMKSEFISIAAHQLRTPLSAVKWVLKMIIDGDMGNITSEQKKFLMKGFASNERMINLVNDLLSVSRIEEGRFLFEFQKMNIIDILKSVLSESEHAIASKQQRLSFAPPTRDFPPLVCDPAKIRIVIQNLIDNAIRYTPAGGSIAITAAKNDKEVKISVSDTGIGIPKLQQRKLFTKFFRGSNVLKISPDGTGLGLFIVRNIIRTHGGEVSVKSEEGKGSTFSFTIPLKQAHKKSE